MGLDLRPLSVLSTLTLWFFLIATRAGVVLRPWEGCVGLYFLVPRGSESGTVLRVFVCLFVFYMVHRI